MKKFKLIAIIFTILAMVGTPVIFQMSKTSRKNYFMVPMRDGKSLFTRVLYPANFSSDGSAPVMLVRTPYDVNSEIYTSQGLAWANKGYVAVLQDLRGLHGSKFAGDFPVFFSDAFEIGRAHV